MSLHRPWRLTRARLAPGGGEGAGGSGCVAGICPALRPRRPRGRRAARPPTPCVGAPPGEHLLGAQEGERRGRMRATKGKEWDVAWGHKKGKEGEGVG